MPPRREAVEPDVSDQQAFAAWLAEQPSEWSVTIALRVALLVLPFLRYEKNLSVMVLPAFRAIAIARFVAKYPHRADKARLRAIDASKLIAPAGSSTTAQAIVFAASSAAAAAALDGRYAAEATSHAAVALAGLEVPNSEIVYSLAKHDSKQLRDGIPPEQLAASSLWRDLPPAQFGAAWLTLAEELHARGDHWSVWTDWYDNISVSAFETSAAEDAAYTDIAGELPWDEGAEAVNTEIARRLNEISRTGPPEIPEQVAAPVRVEERGGKVSKVSDRDSPLSASERDFNAWREPVVDHIEELTSSDFASGTNHSRVRERLTKLGKLLLGEISELKENQFKIGYEVDRFEGLMEAYRTGGEDMPALNAAQLKDLEHLRVALRMGIDKLERWSEFRKQANESNSGEAEVGPEVAGDTLDKMAAVMKREEKYFDPQLPATFRFLSESLRDPMGATKTIVYGAVKSIENVISFLGQRALGIGKKTVEAVETQISKEVATRLIKSLSGAALGLSGAFPKVLAWFKSLLAALGVGG